LVEVMPAVSADQGPCATQLARATNTVRREALTFPGFRASEKNHFFDELADDAMPRGPLVDRTAPAQRRADDPVCRLEAENAELRRQLEVLQSEKLLVENQRNCFKREMDALRKELRETEAKMKMLKPIGNVKNARSLAIIEVEKVLLARYHHADLPMLFVGVLRRVGKNEEGLTDLLFKEHAFQPILKQIHNQRDAQIASHLGTVYDVDLQALLRLIAGISLRRCGLFHQCFRWLNAADGTRTRAMLAPDSRQPAPQLFDLRVMAKCQRDALARSGINLEELSSEETKIDTIVLRELGPLKQSYAKYGMIIQGVARSDAGGGVW